TWTEPMFLTPDRLTAAGSHRPTSTSRIENSLFWPLLMKCSTYRTQPTAMAAFPAHAVIQYDHAFMNPSGLPNATRAYAYGPPSAGRRRESAPNRTARASAPTVVSAIETSVIGPYGASEVGRLKTPTPMIEPMIRAIAAGSPKPCDASAFSGAAAWGAGIGASVTAPMIRRSPTTRVIPSG